MRHALRRILWIVPTLIVTSMIAFFALSKSVGWVPAARPGRPGDADQRRLAELPRFLNTNPRDVRALARAAMRSVAAGHNARAGRLLARLGGAALPYVLPRLDALPPEGRARVALALAPVAERMGVGSPEELDSPDAAVVFWTRFWQERSIDFRDVVVRRMVQRAELDSSAFRREDVEQLDTFALPYLISDMMPVDARSDIARARRLTTLAAHVTGLPWRIPSSASLKDAREAVAAWQDWWLLYRADYMPFDGPRRVIAMLVETQYGKWASAAVHHSLGVTTTGKPLATALKQRAPITLALLLAGLGGGYAIGILLGLLAAARAFRIFDPVSSIVAVVLLAIPAAKTAAWLARSGGTHISWTAALMMILVSAALVSRYQRAASRTALDQDFCSTERAFGASPARIAARNFRASSAAVISLLAVDLPAVLTTAFVVERAFGLDGLGAATLSAVATRDLPWLMAMALLVTVTVALLQILSDLLLGAVDPRVRAELERHRGAID